MGLLSDFHAVMQSKQFPYLPSAEGEIVAVETVLNKRFPKYFKEFLLAYGNDAGNMFCGDHYRLKDLVEINQYADRLFIRNGFPPLGENDLVVSMHQHYSFFYMKDITLDNPPVYLGMEGDEPFVNERLFDTYTDLLYNRQEHLCTCRRH